LASVTQRLSSLSKIDRRRGSVVACAARSQSAAFSHGSIAAPIAPGDFICSVNNGNGTRFHLALLVFLEGVEPEGNPLIFLTSGLMKGASDELDSTYPSRDLHRA
jgi:hypothetical protein